MTAPLNLYYEEPRRPSRREAVDARGIRREGRRVQLMEEEVFGLGQRNMMRAAILDMQRRVLSGNEPGLNTILADIELETLLQAKRVQQSMFGEF
jgi:hypothetical protein